MLDHIEVVHGQVVELNVARAVYGFLYRREGANGWSHYSVFTLVIESLFTRSRFSCIGFAIGGVQSTWCLQV